MTTKGKIGFFGPGSGVIRIAEAVRKHFPQFDYLVLSDVTNSPYGTKTADEIYEFLRQGVTRLLRLDCQAIIIGCNTSSTQATRLRAALTDSELAHTPILDIIEPTLNVLEREPRSEKLAIVGTVHTIKSKAFQLELGRRRPDLQICAAALPKLAQLIDQSAEEKLIEQEIEAGLTPLLNDHPDIETLALCCTHYPTVLPQFRNVLARLARPHVKIISQGGAACEALEVAMRHSSQVSALTKTSNQGSYEVIKI